MELINNVYECSSTLVDYFNSDEKKLNDDFIKNYINERLNTKGNKLPEDFKQGLDWINTSKALSFTDELRGKIIVLDFFTYCCINCMHVLPQLKTLEHQFKVEDGLIVIGVHSPKFANEHSTPNVKAAVERYEITHPIVNDHEECLWNCLGICCWPTLVVVGPGGELLLYLMGESHGELLSTFVKEALSVCETKNLLSHHAITAIGVCNEYRESAEGLHFPGKLCGTKDNSGQLLAIADTGRHRVLVLDQNGNVQHIIGSGAGGLEDGSFQEARFHAPQGLVFADMKTLFVADTENHAIRKIDLENRKVETVVGDGTQGEDRLGGKEGRSQRISSPWDLGMMSPSVLLIAMAGSHQLWAYYLQDTLWWKNKQCKSGVCEAVVGSGQEENRNNTYPMRAGLAQPSGLAVVSSRQCVYVADSESSTVRAVSTSDGKVTNVIGGSADPQNLFTFGDMDGCGQEARLQHPLAVAWSDHSQLLYVADSYNHKIKKVDPTNRFCTTLRSTSLSLNEPGGLYAIENLLYIADTNNHCIKVINLDDNSVQTMQLKFKTTEIKEKKDLNFKPIDESHVILSSKGGIMDLAVSVKVASNIKLNPDAPAHWTLSLPDGWNMKSSGDQEVGKTWAVTFPPSRPSDHTKLAARCKLFICSKDTCLAKQLVFLVNIAFDEDGQSHKTHCIEYHFDS